MPCAARQSPPATPGHCCRSATSSGRPTSARIQAESWSVRATEDHVADLIRQEDSPGAAPAAGPAKPAPKGRTRTSQLAALEQGLRTALGTKVEVRQTASGRGKIVVHFASPAEFERLHDQLCEPQVRSQAG